MFPRFLSLTQIYGFQGSCECAVAPMFGLKIRLIACSGCAALTFRTAMQLKKAPGNGSLVNKSVRVFTLESICTHLISRL